MTKRKIKKHAQPQNTSVRFHILPNLRARLGIVAWEALASTQGIPQPSPRPVIDWRTHSARFAAMYGR